MQRRPFNLKNWINDHRSLLKPPVGNQVLWQDSEFIVMIIGGPNERKDYHINEGEEFFYQLEGDMNLRLFENGKAVDLPIREGEVYMLPANIPHSPQRPANTIGLVVERVRFESETDKFHWYCDACTALVHAEPVHLTNIVTQLPPLFESFWADVAKRTCPQCQHVLERE